MSSRRLRRAALLVSTSLALAGAAHAGLGGALSSVQADRRMMNARLTSTAMGTYTRHDLTRVNGGQVHELTNADGQVFAVTWAGPGKPDLRSLFGSRFTAFQAANGAIGRTMHSLRRPSQVNESDLKIQSSGHMGWFRGVAYVPSLAPAGFSVNDLPQER